MKNVCVEPAAYVLPDPSARVFHAWPQYHRRAVSPRTGIVTGVPLPTVIEPGAAPAPPFMLKLIVTCGTGIHFANNVVEALLPKLGVRIDVCPVLTFPYEVPPTVG